MKWEELDRNLILRGPDFYLSYNPDTRMGRGEALTELCNKLLELADRPERLKNGAETALRGPDREWYILEGDWRKEYEAVFEQGFEACKRVYDTFKKDYRSTWSTDDL